MCSPSFTAWQLLTEMGAICMVEGSVQAAVLALSALAADLVVLALHVVVAEGAGIDVYCIPAWGAILHAHTHTQPFFCLCSSSCS